MITFSRLNTVVAEVDDPNGHLFRTLTGDALEKYGVNIRGWVQASATFNDHNSDDQTITGSFNHDEGVTLNQIALQIEKMPKSNVIGRVGPLPGPKPESFDWGFTLTGIYGSDAMYFKTRGLDDEWDIDKNDEEKLAFNQWFLELYFPLLGGTNLILGSFHTPLLNEIAFPIEPFSTFNSHSMAFFHGPAKHVGALMQTKIPISPEYGLLSLELGVVLGWSNLENHNNDLAALYAIRWRSGNMRTWVDLEGSYGNGEGEYNGTGSPQGGLCKALHKLPYAK